MGLLSLSKDSSSAINKRIRRNVKKNINIIVHVGVRHNRHCIPWRWDWPVHTRLEEKKRLHQAGSCSTIRPQYNDEALSTYPK